MDQHQWQQQTTVLFYFSRAEINYWSEIFVKQRYSMHFWPSLDQTSVNIFHWQVMNERTKDVRDTDASVGRRIIRYWFDVCKNVIWRRGKYQRLWSIRSLVTKWQKKINLYTIFAVIVVHLSTTSAPSRPRQVNSNRRCRNAGLSAYDVCVASTTVTFRSISVREFFVPPWYMPIAFTGTHPGLQACN